MIERRNIKKIATKAEVINARIRNGHFSDFNSCFTEPNLHWSQKWKYNVIVRLVLQGKKFDVLPTYNSSQFF